MLDPVRQLRRKPIGGERLSSAATPAELNARAELDPALQPRATPKWHPTQIKRML